MRTLPSLALVVALPSVVLASRPADVRPSIAERAQPLVRWGTRRVVQVRQTLKSPAARKRFLGASAIMAIDIAGGEAISAALSQPHVPELVASFASSAIPTYTTYFAQRKLHRLAPAWFSDEEKTTPGQLAKDAVFGGVVGTFGGNLVDSASTQLTSALSPHLSIAFGTVMGMNAQASVQVLNAMQWTASQYGSELLGNTSLTLRDRVVDRVKRLELWRGRSRAAIER